MVAGILGINGPIQDRGLIVSGSNMDDLGMGIWNRYSGTYDVQNKPPYDSFIAIVLISGSYKYQVAQNAANIKESVSRVFYAGQWSSWA